MVVVRVRRLECCGCEVATERAVQEEEKRKRRLDPPRNLSVASDERIVFLFCSQANRYRSERHADTRAPESRYVHYTVSSTYGIIYVTYMRGWRGDGGGGWSG